MRVAWRRNRRLSPWLPFPPHPGVQPGGPRPAPGGQFRADRRAAEARTLNDQLVPGPDRTRSGV